MLLIKSPDLRLPRLSTESKYFPKDYLDKGHKSEAPESILFFKDSFHNVSRSEPYPCCTESIHVLKDALYKVLKSEPATSFYRINILP